MFKAIFQLASTRSQYLSLLLSKPLPKDKAPSSDAAVTEILSVFSQAPADDRAYASNLAAIRKAIKEDFQIPLSDTDQSSLDYVYKNFRDEGLDISYRMEGRAEDGSQLEKNSLSRQTNIGKLGNFLANKEDYEFVRDLHRKNW
jgi:hypothetical protein